MGIGAESGQEILKTPEIQAFILIGHPYLIDTKFMINTKTGSFTNPHAFIEAVYEILERIHKAYTDHKSLIEEKSMSGNIEQKSWILEKSMSGLLGSGGRLGLLLHSSALLRLHLHLRLCYHVFLFSSILYL